MRPWNEGVGTVDWKWKEEMADEERSNGHLEESCELFVREEFLSCWVVDGCFMDQYL